MRTQDLPAKTNAHVLSTVKVACAGGLNSDGSVDDSDFLLFDSACNDMGCP